MILFEIIPSAEHVIHNKKNVMKLNGETMKVLWAKKCQNKKLNLNSIR